MIFIKLLIEITENQKWKKIIFNQRNVKMIINNQRLNSWKVSCKGKIIRRKLQVYKNFIGKRKKEKV